MIEDLSRILYHESTILARLDEMAHEITWDYRDKELTAVAVLNGSFMFLGDLLRRIPIPLQVDCLSVSSYSGDRSTGIVTFDQSTMPDIEGRHVLVLDDILDGGYTLHAVRERLLEQKPLSVKFGVLLRKNRTREKVIDVDYVGFDIADEFVVGYGLDFMQNYRNLPCIGVLGEDVIQQGMAKLREKADADKAPAS